jgi:hypothetical protein
LSRGNLGRNPDRYGDTYQSGISDDTILESGENINSIAMGRKEAAHIILKILSKLQIPWMRDPKRLPGWRDGL